MGARETDRAVCQFPAAELLEPTGVTERERTSMNPWHVIQGLYESEINSGMESDWSGGITAWIAEGGTRMAQRTFPPDEFGEIADWLDLEARRLFPDSRYATAEVRLLM